MPKNHFRAIFLSDAHLCSRDCRAGSLLSFLKFNKCDTLYLVGDIIDVWQLKRKWFWPQDANNVIHKILGMSKKGTRVGEQLRKISHNLPLAPELKRKGLKEN